MERQERSRGSAKGPPLPSKIHRGGGEEMMTLNDIKKALLKFDEITLLEILNISSEDIVDRFEDFIEREADSLEEELEDDEAFYSGSEDWLDGKEDTQD
jgi:hypothetical protein